MHKIEKIKSQEDEDLGFLMWQLETFEDFYPVYKTLIKKEK